MPRFGSSLTTTSLTLSTGQLRYVTLPPLTGGISAGAADDMYAMAFVRGPIQASTAAGAGFLYTAAPTLSTPHLYVYRPSDYGGWHDSYDSSYPGGISGGIDNIGPITYFGGYYWQGISPAFADGKQIIRIELSSSVTLTTPVTLATTTALNTAWPLHNGTSLFFVSGTFVHNSSGTIVGTLSSGTIASRRRYREWDTDEHGLMMVRIGDNLQSSRDGSTWTTLTLPGGGTGGGGIGYNSADSCWYTYMGDDQVWKSNTAGTSWSAVCTMPAIVSAQGIHFTPYEGLMLMTAQANLGGGDTVNMVWALHPELTQAYPVYQPFPSHNSETPNVIAAPGRVGWFISTHGTDVVALLSPTSLVELP